MLHLLLVFGEGRGNRYVCNVTILCCAWCGDGGVCVCMFTYVVLHQIDDPTGRTYYYNHDTGESTWEAPNVFRKGHYFREAAQKLVIMSTFASLAQESLKALAGTLPTLSPNAQAQSGSQSGSRRSLTSTGMSPLHGKPPSPVKGDITLSPLYQQQQHSPPKDKALSPVRSPQRGDEHAHVNNTSPQGSGGGYETTNIDPWAAAEAVVRCVGVWVCCIQIPLCVMMR